MIISEYSDSSEFLVTYSQVKVNFSEKFEITILARTADKLRMSIILDGSLVCVLLHQ